MIALTAGAAEGSDSVLAILLTDSFVLGTRHLTLIDILTFNTIGGKLKTTIT